jgi:hypothetical protein
MTDKHSAGNAAAHDTSPSPATRPAADRRPASSITDHVHALAELLPA